VRSRNSAAPTSVGPQPGLRAGVGETLNQVAPDSARLLAHRRAARHEAHRQCGDCECCRVDHKGLADTEHGYQQPAQRRPREAQPERFHQLAHRVGLQQLVARHDVRHDRRECGLEERLADPVDHNQGDHMPELRGLRERQRGDGADRHEPQQVGGDQQPSALEAVAEHARDQQRRDHRQRPRESDQPECGRLV
jgi:hypothetical protein